MSTADDRDLALRAQAGYLDAFAELVRRYQVVVFNVAYRMLGRRLEAEDATQEAFLRAFRAFDTFDAERPLAPWLKRIAANVCLNMLESARVKPLDTFADMDHPRVSVPDSGNRAYGRRLPEQTVLDEEFESEVRAAILQLPPRYRAVIELRHFQDLSYEEIGSTMNRSLANVKSDLFRARKMLADRLRKLRVERRK